MSDIVAVLSRNHGITKKLAREIVRGYCELVANEAIETGDCLLSNQFRIIAKHQHQRIKKNNLNRETILLPPKISFRIKALSSVIDKCETGRL